jgi:hypothetical protein
MTLRLRYLTLKLRALCWILQRLRAGQRSGRDESGIQKKPPDLAARRALCDQTRGRRSQAWEEAKPELLTNIQAKFRPIFLAAGAGGSGGSIRLGSSNI